MVTLYIIRTSPGYLALCRVPTSAQLAIDEEYPGTLVLLRGQGVIALPDPAFWALLKAPRPHHNPSIYAEMVAEDSARMARVEGSVGVGKLRFDETILSQSELTRANAHTKAPKPGTFEED